MNASCLCCSSSCHPCLRILSPDALPHHPPDHHHRHHHHHRHLHHHHRRRHCLRRCHHHLQQHQHRHDCHQHYQHFRSRPDFPSKQPPQVGWPGLVWLLLFLRLTLNRHRRLLPKTTERTKDKPTEDLAPTFDPESLCNPCPAPLEFRNMLLQELCRYYRNQRIAEHLQQGCPADLGLRQL